MNICIFYSWQSSYENNCDTIIQEALCKAVEALNSNVSNIQYVIERGGGDVLGAEHIDDKVEEVIKHKADLAFVDFTHVGKVPQQDPHTGAWVKEKCTPNTNAVHENGMLEGVLSKRQVFKVYNTAYGELNLNLEMPFDMRQQLFPLGFFCSDETTEEEREIVRKDLAEVIKNLIEQGTEEVLNNQRIRFAPLHPLRQEFSKALYQGPFFPSKFFGELKNLLASGKSIRLMGLPGLGKTRMLMEAMREDDVDGYYCDCRDQSNRDISDAVEKLLSVNGKGKPVVILDNCTKSLSGKISDLIYDNGFHCQLITIYYDPGEIIDSGIEPFILRVKNAAEVVEAIVDQAVEMPADVKEAIIEFSGGFPLMASMMMDNYHKQIPITKVSKGDVFDRMLGIDRAIPTDVDKWNVLKVFSLFKFIGLYGRHEKHGRFIAGNPIITKVKGSKEEKFQLFKDVYGQYSEMDILERQGDLVLMRLIPLAIYLCTSWFRVQTSESIADLIRQIQSHPDEGTRNLLMESLSRRIVLLNEVPLAQRLKEELTNPGSSPFLIEEVVLSPLGSRLFLAFSEVNPASCASALYPMLFHKSDEEIKALEPARRNLVWALDHLAFDRSSFHQAMCCLARLSLIETEGYLSNNTTGLFLGRFTILLAGTEVDLQERMDLLNELLSDSRYETLVKQALLEGLRTGYFTRSGGAEKQGMKKLVDYIPSYQEINTYYTGCFGMYLDLAKTPVDREKLAEVLASNARGYYLSGFDSFLFESIAVLAPRKDFIWEEMKEALSFILMYDQEIRNGFRWAEIEEWKARLTKDDYVYRFLHAGSEFSQNFDGSFEDTLKQIKDLYCAMARELVDQKLYSNKEIMAGLAAGKCAYSHIYGLELSSYSKAKGAQKELLDVLLSHVLHKLASSESEAVFIYFLKEVEDRELLKTTYDTLLHSSKKYLLVAAYAIKAEGEDKLNELFEMLDRGELSISDFSLYFIYSSLSNVTLKTVIGRVLDYGSQGATLVFSHCRHFLFETENVDEDYQTLGRQCLLKIDGDFFRSQGYLCFRVMNNYLVEHHDEELALHIQALLEESLSKPNHHNNYYFNKLYQKVLLRYSGLLKDRLLLLLDDRTFRYQVIELLRTFYPEDGINEPAYTFISEEEWFEWVNEDREKQRENVLASMFYFADDDQANPKLVRLFDIYWSDEVRDSFSTRFHSFSWTGSGIPLYESRIALCEDYNKHLTNTEAKAWFRKDIHHWENSIKEELLRNAHEKAIYD